MEASDNFIISPEHDLVPAHPPLSSSRNSSQTPQCQESSLSSGWPGLPSLQPQSPWFMNPWVYPWVYMTPKGPSGTGLVTTGSHALCSARHPVGQMDSVTEIHMAQKAWPCESFIHNANIYQRPHSTLGCLALRSRGPQSARTPRRPRPWEQMGPLPARTTYDGLCPRDSALDTRGRKHIRV